MMKQCKVFLTALAMTCCLALLTTGAAAASASSTAGRVTTQSTGLTVRATASASATQLALLPKGSHVTLLGRSGAWWQVEYAANRTGYVHGDYITPLAGSEARRVNASALNVRSGPSTGYGVAATLYRGSYVQPLGKAGSWTKILYHGVKIGFVDSSYLAAPGTGGTGSAPLPPPTDTTTGKAIRLSVPSMKQYDSRWAAVQLGKSGQNMKQIGCTTTALAMTESYRTGSTIRPDTLSRQLGYTAGGAVYWPARYRAETGSGYLSVLRKKLEAGVPVIVGAKTAGGKGHWVVVTGHSGAATLRAADFSVHDPGSSWRTNLQQLFNEYPYFYKLEYYTY